MSMSQDSREENMLKIHNDFQRVSYVLRCFHSASCVFADAIYRTAMMGTGIKPAPKGKS
jgi:hypothetical protein